VQKDINQVITENIQPSKMIVQGQRKEVYKAGRHELPYQRQIRDISDTAILNDKLNIIKLKRAS
jgi:hypothetical protein